MGGLFATLMQGAALVVGYQNVELWVLLLLALGSALGIAIHEPQRLVGGTNKPWLGFQSVAFASVLSVAVLYSAGRLIRILF
jgi:hypothetical protein